MKYRIAFNGFQSTLPVWGATEAVQMVMERLEISIHAPRVGSDGAVDPAGRHGGHISIHAPRVGSDFRRVKGFDDMGISIHAPRVGSDGCLPEFAF